MSALNTGADMTNESNCGAFGSLLASIKTILHHLLVPERVCLDLRGIIQKQYKCRLDYTKFFV
jgi:hypothetical protein